MDGVRGDGPAGKGRLQMNPERAVGAGATLCSWESLRDEEGEAGPPGPGAGAAHGSQVTGVTSAFSCRVLALNQVRPQAEGAEEGLAGLWVSRGLSEQLQVRISF